MMNKVNRMFQEIQGVQRNTGCAGEYRLWESKQGLQGNTGYTRVNRVCRL